MGGISLWQLLIIFLIVLLLFGTKKLRGLGSDLGSAVKGFRSAVKEGEKDEAAGQERIAHSDERGHVIEGEVATKDKDKNKA